MARSDTRYSVYPAPKAVEILGSTSPALNQAIECWAALLVRAMADNSKIILPVGDPSAAPRSGEHEVLHEWCVLAEALHGKRFDPDFARPGDLLATAVEDAHRLESVGEKWFRSKFGGKPYEEWLEKRVTDLVENLHRLDYAHAWAVIVAVQWFWEHHDEGIDINDPWWTVAFRRQWEQEHSASKRGAVASIQGKGTKARAKKPPSQ